MDLQGLWTKTTTTTFEKKSKNKTQIQERRVGCKLANNTVVSTVAHYQVYISAKHVIYVIKYTSFSRSTYVLFNFSCKNPAELTHL